MVRIRFLLTHVVIFVCIGIGYTTFYRTSYAQAVDALVSYVVPYRVDAVKQPLQVIYLKKAKLFMPRIEDEDANISMVVLDRVIRLPRIFLPPLTEVV